MTNLVVTQNKSLNWFEDDKKKQLLKDLYFKTASDEEFLLFLHACEKTSLDPMMKQIYPVKRYDSTLKRECMTIQTGIDGYRLVAERTGRYAPGKETTYTYDKNGQILSATAYVKKLTKDGTWHEIPATAYFSEYCQKTKDGSPAMMWQKMPHNQLAKCAEALALRKAFPNELSGLYTREEMMQSQTVEAEVVPQIKELISEEQVMEIKDVLSECDPIYVQKVMAHLKASDNSIDSIEKIPVNLYERIKNAALKKAEEYKKKEEEIINV